LETKIGWFNVLEAMLAIALWLMSVPEPAPQPTQRLIGLEGKVSARVWPPTRRNKAMDTKMVRSILFIKSSFLLGFHSGFHFTKKVYFVKFIPGSEKSGRDGFSSDSTMEDGKRCLKNLRGKKTFALEFANWGNEGNDNSTTPNSGFGNSLNFFKHIFGSAAHGANPVVGKFVKRCIGRNIPVRIAFSRIINVTTDFALPFLHLNLLFTPFPTLPLEGEGAPACR
jgi:hypothetical protein